MKIHQNQTADNYWHNTKMTKISTTISFHRGKFKKKFTWFSAVLGLLKNRSGQFMRCILMWHKDLTTKTDQIYMLTLQVGPAERTTVFSVIMIINLRLII